MMYAVQITIVNLDRNELDLAQGWYVPAESAAGGLAEVLRLLLGSEHLPQNPFSEPEDGQGLIITPGGGIYQGEAGDR